MTRLVALVTGASSGIGAATAELLAEHGYDVVLTGRDPSRLAQVAERVGGRVCVGDLRSVEAVDQLVASSGRVDLLVGNAGIGWAGAFSSMPVGLLDELLCVDLTATLRLCRAVLPGMLHRGRGHIVLVSSIAGCMGVPGEAAYSAAKAGLRGFAASLRAELAAKPVGVSVVLPGVVDTPFFDRRGEPYTRRWPRPVPAKAVAAAVLDAAECDRAEVFVPRWLRVAARLRGLAPGLTDAIQRHTPG